jgi:hypothetical protein
MMQVEPRTVALFLPSPLVGEGCVGLASEATSGSKEPGGGAGWGMARRETRALGRAQSPGPQRGITPHPNLPPQGGKGRLSP